MIEQPEKTSSLRGFDDFESKLGDELRGERATLGKSLLDVQRDLKIKAAYISAVENCDPSVFPNQGFVAGYVRSYARYLGIDPDQMYQRFQKESGFTGVNAGMQAASNGRLSGKSLKRNDESARTGFESFVAPPQDSLLNLVSPSGITSVLVLASLIFGLAAGGWSILKDIQRVEFVPVDQTPGVVANIQTATTDLGDQETTEINNSVLATNAQPEIATDVLGRLYRPQELAIPKVVPRDGPIAAINPDKLDSSKPEALPNITEVTASAPLAVSEEISAPIVTIVESSKNVQLFATRAAWVRVHLEDGTVLFEKILEKGERYTIPEGTVDPLLRAGNSGSVFVLLDDQIYGPVGSGTSVAKQVSLVQENIEQTYQVASDVELPIEDAVSTARNQ